MSIGTLGTSLTALVDTLNSTQSALSVISNNIANANTTGYTKRIVSQETKIANGTATGVGVLEIRRAVDDYLNNSALGQVANVGYSNIKNSYYNRLHSTILGAPNSSGTIGKSLSDFYTALDSYSNDPSSAVKRTLSVNAAGSLATNISNLASQIQQQRLTADTDLSSKITETNNILTDLSDLNTSIQQNSGAGADINSLLDVRDQKLMRLKELMNVSLNYNGIGQVTAYINNTEILSPDSKFTINYSRVNSVNTFTNGSTIGPITVTAYDKNGNQSGSAETLFSASSANPKIDNLPTGEIRALVDLRDKDLPNILSQLDNLAYNVIEQFNSVHNMGSGYPPVTSYKGQEALALSDKYYMSGSFKVGIVDSYGNPVKNTYGESMLPMNLDLSNFDSGSGPGTASVADILKEINQYFGGTTSDTVNIGPIKDLKLGVLGTSVTSTKATGSLSFSANPADNTTISINGVTLTFSDNPSGPNSVQRGSTLAESLNNLRSALIASANTNIKAGSYSVSGTALNITSETSGSVGNSFAISAGTSGATASGATLSGGVNASGNFTFDFDMQGNDPQGGAIKFEVQGLTVNGSPVASNFNPYTLTSGTAVRTDKNGTSNDNISVAIPAGLNEGDTFTIGVQVKVTDSNGNVSTDTINYTVKVPDPQDNIMNNRIKATSVSGTGDAKMDAATFSNNMLSAKLVNANGLPITNPNEKGYLVIDSNNANYRIVIDDMDSSNNGIYNSADPTVSATGRGFGHMFGLNNLFNSVSTVNNAAINMSVRSDIVKDPSLLASARLTVSATTGTDKNYTYQIGSSSNAIAQEFVKLQNKNISFSSSGGLPSLTTTMDSFSTEIYNYATVQANSAESEYNKQNLLYTSVTKQIDETGGVNIDEEIANTVNIQNNYSAAARLLSIVRDLFKELTQSV